MNSWDFGAVCGDFPAVRVPEQADSGRLHAVFTSPPPTLHLAGDIDEWTFPDLTENPRPRGGRRSTPDSR